MDNEKEEAKQTPRRTTRSSALSSVLTSNNVSAAKANSLEPLTINDLLVGGDPISLDDLISSFPGRSSQIHEILRLLGPLNSPMLPLFVYGAASTAKTSIILQLFRHLNRPLVYSSCRTCYNQRILFESVLNQLLLHRKNAANGYSNAKRCERPSDFVSFLREALTNVINNLKERSEKMVSNKMTQGRIGNMIYLVFDNFQLVRDWDKSSVILPLLFNLYDLLKMPEVGLIFISSTSPDTFYSNMGYVEPIPVYFPDYTEGDIRQILLRSQANPKLYSSFLDVALRPFVRITRQVDELFTAFKPLYEKYCEPFVDKGIVPNEDMKRRLFSHIKPHITSALNEIFKVSSLPSTEVQILQNSKETKPKGNFKNFKLSEEIGELDFHMSTSAKYLLISAFLASRNPATLDASLFDSKGGSENRKRKRKPSEKSLEKKETLEEELLMKGPGTFPLERLLAIFQCIVSVADEQSDEEEQNGYGSGVQAGLMADVLLQLSSLCNANYIFKGRSCPIEGSTRYRSMISEDLALKVARSLKFPLSKYLYRI